MDRWTSKKVILKGGLNQEQDIITQGEANMGSAKVLQNFEPALEGGYKRIQGYSKWDSTVVPGQGPILGVATTFDGVFGARKNAGGTGVDIHYSTGGGSWTQINSTVMSSAANKCRFTTYTITQRVLVVTDGLSYAQKWNGTTMTVLSALSAPTAPKYAIMWNNRLVLGYSNFIAISAPSDDEDFRAVSGGAEINVGDEVVGFGKFRETLYLFCRNSIRKLTGTSNADFLVQTVTDSIGCIAGDTIAEIAGDIVFLAPDGLRTIAATDRIGDIELGLLSQPIQPLVRDKIGDISEDGYSALPIRKKSQYRLFFYKTGVEDDSAEGIGGKVSADPSNSGSWEWFTLSGINAYCCDSAYISAQIDEVAVFGHPSNGYVYRLDRGNSFDGNDVHAIYRSPDLTFDDGTVRKVLQKIDLYTQVDGDMSAQLSVKFDIEDARTLQPQPITLSSEGLVALYGSGIYGTSKYSAKAFPVFKKNLVGSGFLAAFVVSSADINPPYRIDSYQVQYSIKGRR